MIADPNRHYRVRKPSQEWELINMADLVHWLFTHESSVRPRQLCYPHGEWYCQNPRCSVREVRIKCKYLDEKPPESPPAMKCPSCSQVLKFHHYLVAVTLEPVDEANRESEPLASPPAVLPQ
jgi:hypothetical protein